MTPKFRDGCPECMKICFMLGMFFQGDGEKAAKWMQTPNPGLGGVTPEHMMDEKSREKKLARWIYNQIDANRRI